MDDESKVVKIGAEARESVRKAVKIMGEAVCRTLGPKGRNALIDRGRMDRSPLITNDGKTIAKSLRANGKIKIGEEVIDCDETVDKVLHTLFEVAKLTDEVAGDGTTTSITVTRAIVEESLDRIPEGDVRIPGQASTSPMELVRQLEDEKNQAIDLLKEMAQPVETLEHLKDIAFTSLENREAADVVAEAVYTVGKDGYVTVDDGYEGKVEAETVSGIKIYAKVAAPFMYTNDRRQAIFENAPVLVTNFHFQNLGVLQSLFDDMTKEAKGQYNAMVIMASKFDADVLKQILRIYQVGKAKSEGAAGFRILAVKVPSLTDEELEDVAHYLDARFINTDNKVGDKIEKVKFRDLGFAKRVTAGDDETIIMGGRGTEVQVYEGKKDEGPTTRVEARLKSLRETLTVEHDEMFKNKLTRRIEILSGGVAVLRVGAQSDTERAYLKLKVEDAKNACKCALQEGMVPGGGLALREIALKLGENALLFKALEAPHIQIMTNAGGVIEIPKNIKDPAKVVRCALENAVSVAKILITTETIIADKQRNVGDELKEMMNM